MTRSFSFFAITVFMLSIAACSTGVGGRSDQDVERAADAAIASSFHGVPEDWKSRLMQDEVQRLCSEARDRPGKALAERIEAISRGAGVLYPADGKRMGDFKRGERLAQSGYGLRVGDDTKREAGGNCYACHQLTKQEISYGTLGPSLLGFGKLRGANDAVIKYTYDKIYNAQSFTACSNMPRFGTNKILTPEQIADLVALLLDPNSPVNQ